LRESSGKVCGGETGIGEENPVLKAYLQVEHVRKLGPDTLIPAGILVLCQNMYPPATVGQTAAASRNARSSSGIRSESCWVETFERSC
jgi:hypothetical protein